MEVTLCAALEGIGKDRMCKRSSARQKLSREVERVAIIVAALQAGTAKERLRASVEQIEKSKNLDKWKDACNVAQEEKNGCGVQW